MLGKAAMPLPRHVPHVMQAQALCPCLAATLAWPLPESRGPPNYHDRLPAAEPLPLSIFTVDESLPSFGLIDRALAARIADLRS